MVSMRPTARGEHTNRAQSHAPGAATLASHYADFLHEQAPEAVLSRLHNDTVPVAPNAILFRRLISVLLRASTPHTVQRVESSLASVTNRARAQNCDHFVVLGFTSSSVEEHRAALHDALNCLVYGEMLAVDGKALTLYSGAGSGATDQEEYMMPASDGLRGSSSFGSMHPPLADTRRTALVAFVKHLAKHSASIFANDARVLALLTEKTLTRAASLYSDALEALHALLNQLYSVASSRIRDDISVRLVNAFSAVGQDDQLRPSLGVYLRAMPGPVLMIDCTRRFLVQRFSLKIAKSERLSFNVFFDLINRQHSSNHPFLKVLPALCACVATALVSQDDLRDLKSDLSAFQPDEVNFKIGTMISLGEEFRRTCNPPPADGDWFINTLHALHLCVKLRNK